MAETKWVKYIGSLSAVEIEGYSIVKRGESIELPREVADKYLSVKESWQPGTAKSGKGE